MRILEMNVKLTRLGRNRRIRVLLPDSYESDSRRYPVLYMHDGQNIFTIDVFGGGGWHVHEEVRRSGADVLVVAIDNNPDGDGTARYREYCPWRSPKTVNRKLGIGEQEAIGGEGWGYLASIVEDVKPLIDQTFRTDPGDSAMAGSSAGGLISLCAACRYPHVFKRAASLSGAFWLAQEDTEKLAEESDLSILERLYLDIGTEEVTGAFTAGNYLTSNRAVNGLLAEKGTDHRYLEIEGGTHNESDWRARFADVLKYLYDEQGE
ncbi:alpha/beta hydrolase [Alteribacter lacisalsi]|nr:esterase family protein [Alteribacter lacisalsi]